MLKREPSSYRDPDGYISYIDDDIYRCVTNDNAPITSPDYKAFFDKALARGLLVPFELADTKASSESSGTLLKLEKLPVVSYPYEWGFEQLKEAALLTLDICALALDHGLSLKDATAFNIQQYNGKMIFIDHTSFEPSDNMLPWRPYSQFCRHFLAPLLVMSRRGYNANKRFRTEMDGLDIKEACLMLPFLDRFRPSVFIHMYLHNFLINSNKNSNATPNPKKDIGKRSGTKGSQKLFIEHLRKVISKIKPPRYATEWHDYYNATNYNDDSFTQKEAAIKDIAQKKSYECVWDIGGNNGHFSRILADHAQTVLSMDIDYAAIDLNYLKNKQQDKTNIYPLVMDLTNPSPALGLGNTERTIIGERSSPDLIVALALIHHLTITYNIPFAMFAQQLRSYDAELLIEYVGREDNQFQKLLYSKNDPYDHYNQGEFEASFATYFKLVKKTEITGTHRCLYHFVPK